MPIAKNKKPIIIASILLILAIIAGSWLFKKNGSPFFGGKEPHKIRLAWPLNGGIITGQVGAILQNKEYLQKNGFDAVEVKNFKSGNDLRLAMASGQADVILADETTFARILGQGFKAYAVASLGTDGKMALVTAINSDANSTEDLKGNPVKPAGHGARKIGVTFGTAQHKQVLDWLSANGLDSQKDCKLINVPDNISARGRLLDGTLDAIVADGLSLAENLAAGKYKKLEQSDLRSVVAVSADWAEKNPESVKKLQESLKDAIMYLVQNRQQAAAWYGGYSKNDKDAVSQASQTEKIYGLKKRSDIDLSISADIVARLTGLTDFLAQQKMIQNRAEVKNSVL